MKKFKILIVDDNDFFRQTLKATLKGSFPTIAIDEVANGGEALEKADTFLPDFIFMDIRLPGQNGLVLTKKSKQLIPILPFLF